MFLDLVLDLECDGVIHRMLLGDSKLSSFIFLAMGKNSYSVVKFHHKLALCPQSFLWKHVSHINFIVLFMFHFKNKNALALSNRC